LQFVADAGTYTDNQADAFGREAVTYATGGVAVAMAVLALSGGGAIGVATGSLMPQLYGIAVAVVITYVPQIFDNTLTGHIPFF
jgi:hypothetical protein